jgi:hypothetical protein
VQFIVFIGLPHLLQVQHKYEYSVRNDHICQRKISQSTRHKSQLVIGHKYLYALLMALQPTFTTEPPICLIEGAKGLLRPRGPTPSSSINLPHTPHLLTPSQNIYHPTKANTRSIKSFSSPSRKYNPFCPLFRVSSSI